MAKNSYEIFWKVKKDTALLKFSLFLEKEKSALVFEAVPVVSGEFAWDSEIAIGLNIQELGILLGKLASGAGQAFRSPATAGQVKFTHDLERKSIKGEQQSSSKGNRTLTFERHGDSLEVKLGIEVNNQEIRNARLNLDPHETAMLELLLRKSIERIMGF
jgi:hypothetical protein